jgi:hypothetical protein
MLALWLVVASAKKNTVHELYPLCNIFSRRRPSFYFALHAAQHPKHLPSLAGAFARDDQ